MEMRRLLVVLYGVGSFMILAGVCMIMPVPTGVGVDPSTSPGVGTVLILVGFWLAAKAERKLKDE